MIQLLLISFLFNYCILTLNHAGAWGFNPHKLINRHAVFTLPPAMITFYKHHIHFISEEAVKADHRRYAIPQEGARHYIDIDFYGLTSPISWDDLKKNYHNDSIESHGILPWYLLVIKSQLTKAFMERNIFKILRLSADAGHYIADAHVPLHTTFNYDGQFTGQHGIHGLWETRIPELFHENFDLWVGRASYRNNWGSFIWEVVMDSHAAVDSVLRSEQQLTAAFPVDKKYTFEVRLSRMVKAYSEDFSKRYHKALNNQVEKRLKAAIVAVGDFWYSCWIDAGQPDLAGLDIPTPTESEQTFDSLWRRDHSVR